LKVLSHLAGLVRHVQEDGAGDHAEFHRLYLESYGFVRQRARLMLRDDEAARDAAQETFTRAWAHWRSFAQARTRMGWLMVTVTRICIDRQRSRRLEQGLAEAGAPVAHPVRAEEGHLAHLLWLRIRQETPVCQQVILHTCLDGMTQVEAAEHLDISRRTVQRVLDAFRAKHGGDLAMLGEFPSGS
jgi:RNA polymerase sigma factor (sigma-70 family)